MHRLIQILPVLLLLASASATQGQTPLTCGITDIDGPAQVEPGRPLVFKARVTSMTHTTKPEFKWNVSAGTITSGQGTDEITVDTVGLGGLEITATAELSGASLGCKVSASRIAKVEPPPITCRLAFDRYGDIKFADEKARLDNFAIQLTDEPLSSGHILVSAGQETFQGEAEERLERAKSYLVTVRELDPNRIVTVDCGFTAELNVSLYIAPLGAAHPECSNSTEAPSFEVKFTKPRPKSLKKPR